MGAFVDIAGGLDNHLANMVGAPDIAYQNREFPPDSGTLFVRPTTIMGDVFRASVSASGAKDWYPGVYQVDVFAPAGEAAGEGITMADTIADRFKRGTEITNNGRVIRCMDATFLPPEVDGDWMITPLQINFYSLTAER